MLYSVNLQDLVTVAICSVKVRPLSIITPKFRAVLVGDRESESNIKIHIKHHITSLHDMS